MVSEKHSEMFLFEYLLWLFISMSSENIIHKEWWSIVQDAVSWHSLTCETFILVLQHESLPGLKQPKW